MKNGPGNAECGMRIEIEEERRQKAGKLSKDYEFIQFFEERCISGSGSPGN
jgi:hypothetical protein